MDDQNKNKGERIDNKIIEHLACLEINSLILKPPFRLVGNIQVDDKGISYDGEIQVYNNTKLIKSNVVGEVRVQVKGTTTFKKIHKLNKIKHRVEKKDIEVYNKFGVGVLYFVVTINPSTYKRQAYYRLFAPIELKKLLLELNNRGKDTKYLNFKKLEEGHLEYLCSTLLEVTKKQPQKFLEANIETNFKNYKVDFIDVNKDSFNLFEETAYIYGLTAENIEIPLDVAHLSKINKADTESIYLNDEEVNISFEITVTEKISKVVIENTLSFVLNKDNSLGQFHLGRLKTLSSYLKCLQVIKHYIKSKNLSFRTFQLKGEMSMDKFQNIEEEINSYKELIKVCAEIGISEDYVFNDKENLPILFNGIIKVFKDKKYELLTNLQEAKLQNIRLYSIELSDYVTVSLIYTGDKFINFYSKEALTTIGGLLPKEQGNERIDCSLDKWEDHYLQVSIYSSQNVNKMAKDANFNFEILKLSFSNKYHDIKTHATINVSLSYINYYNEFHDEKFLELALDLNQRHLDKVPEDIFARINIYLIKLIKGHTLLEEEQSDILDIQEKAEVSKNKQLCFACEVLLRSKMKAERIFNSLNDREQKEVMGFPIYHFYKDLR